MNKADFLFPKHSLCSFIGEILLSNQNKRKQNEKKCAIIFFFSFSSLVVFFFYYFLLLIYRNRYVLVKLIFKRHNGNIVTSTITR